MTNIKLVKTWLAKSDGHWTPVDEAAFTWGDMLCRLIVFCVSENAKLASIHVSRTSDSHISYTSDSTYTLCYDNDQVVGISHAALDAFSLKWSSRHASNASFCLGTFAISTVARVENSSNEHSLHIEFIEIPSGASAVALSWLFS